MNGLKICQVSSEVTPFAKTGGLADVSAALTRFLGKAGHDVRLFMPMYSRVLESDWEFRPVAKLQDISVEFGDKRYFFSISNCRLPDSEVNVHFIRCPELYAREEIYSDAADEHLRFAMLVRATLECCQRLGWAPDIFHCHDWHAALLPLYLNTLYAWDDLFSDSKTMLTIHNIGYQGTFSKDTLTELGLEDRSELFYQEDLRDGQINFLKTGLLYASVITTVSETYAEEIQTEEFGMGLEGLLRARSDTLFGIVNGVDYGDWNPEADRLIPHSFSAKDLTGKARDKQALLESLDLVYDPQAPVLGIVSRLTFQKGFELLPDILPVFLQRDDLRLVVLGSGEEKYEQYFQWLQESYPGKVGFSTGYNNELAHLIEAGSDIFLMPSRYEPCGLNQMYSLRYGTVPIVRKTGGLADTVEPYDARGDAGTGFVFEEFTAEALFQAIDEALLAFADERAWHSLVLRGMAKDFSWERQGARYVDLYRELLPGS